MDHRRPTPTPQSPPAGRWTPAGPSRRALLASLPVALVLAGCGGGPVAEPTQLSEADPTALVEITWWTGQADQPQQIIEDLVDEFTEAHPNVTVTTSAGASTTDQLLGQLSASFAGGTYPDISYAYGSWASELAASGRALDVTEQVESDPDVDWAGFSDAARDTAAPDGTVIGFPAVVDNLAVVYNKELLARAGVPEPSADWTWEDFRAASKAVSDLGEGMYGTNLSVSGGEDTTWRLWPLLWQNGGQVLDDDETQAAFDSPEGVEALETLRAMAVDDGSVYLDQTDEKYGPLFREGRIGMMVTGPWEIYETHEAGIDYGVQVLPGVDGSHTTVTGPDLWVLYDHQDANRAYWAYELISWMTAGPQDARFSLALGNLPLSTSTTQTPEYEAFLQQFPGADVFVANQDNATVPRPTVQGYNGLSAAVGEAVAGVLQGAAEPQPALEEAATEADRALEEAR